jgi:hypothetical protein
MKNALFDAIVSGRDLDPGPKKIIFAHNGELVTCYADNVEFKNGVIEVIDLTKLESVDDA